MKKMPENSVDSIVTDPPYELGFMGKSWDNSGIAYSVEMWSEALRILKPGGHLLAFGGTRTYHRMAVAIEDAGFEIRDSIHWIYGSGFPKSHDVSKAIDKAAGAEREGKIVRSAATAYSSNAGNHRPWMDNDGEMCVMGDTPATPEAEQWQGWGTALKPAHEPIVVARKPLIGTVAANVLKHGTGALNIDGSRIGIAKGDEPKAGKQTATFGTQETISGGDGSGGWQASSGRWPANVIFGHDEDCEQVGTVEESLTINKVRWPANVIFGRDEDCEQVQLDYTSSPSTTNVPIWKCTSGCAVAELDAQSGLSKGGGASRFFYCAKASKSEKNAGLDHLDEVTKGSNFGNDGARPHTSPDYKYEATTRNTHPTVKPVALMRYLVRLVTPPGGVVFDPFLGSGTTAVAAILEGFDWKGCEMTEEYWPIISARVDWAKKQSPEAQEFKLFGTP